MAAKQAMKENLQCTSKYGHLRISWDICHVRMTDIEGFLTIYGHSGNLLNNNYLISGMLEYTIVFLIKNAITNCYKIKKEKKRERNSERKGNKNRSRSHD